MSECSGIAIPKDVNSEKNRFKLRFNAYHRHMPAYFFCCVDHQRTHFGDTVISVMRETGPEIEIAA